MCSFSKEGEQEDVSLCGFAFANGEVGEEQSFASSMHYERAPHFKRLKLGCGAASAPLRSVGLRSATAARE